jgi:hypothetical protein
VIACRALLTYWQVRCYEKMTLADPMQGVEDSVTVWVAPQTAAKVTLTVLESRNLAMQGSRDTIAGESRHIVAVTATPRSLDRRVHLGLDIAAPPRRPRRRCQRPAVRSTGRTGEHADLTEFIKFNR